MASWNVVWVKAREYELLNGSQTAVRLSRASKFNVPLLMSRMEELDVPPAYSVGLKEISFTQLRGGDHGDYLDCRIRMSSDKKTQDIMEKVFIHELAHHVDDMHDVTSDEQLIREKKKRAQYMDDGYAKKNVSEYLAVGFEVYYCGTEEERSRLKKKNPILFKTIVSLHRKLSKI